MRRLCLSIVLILNSNPVWAQCEVGDEVCLKLQADAAEVTQSNAAYNAGALVDSITDDLKARRLTKPLGNNALEKIQRLKTIDPEHDYSINGVRYVCLLYTSPSPRDS